MKALLILAAALSCRPGFALIDWSKQLPPRLSVLDVVVSLKPFYARVVIYPLENPSEEHWCCGNKPASVLRLPVGSGKFCVRQSQPDMNWKMRVFLKPDVAI